MKTTVYKLTDSRLENTDPLFDVYDEIYKIPTLPAYAVLSHSLDYNLMYLDSYDNHQGYELFDDYMVIQGVKKLFHIEYSLCFIKCQHCILLSGALALKVKIFLVIIMRRTKYEYKRSQHEGI